MPLLVFAPCKFQVVRATGPQGAEPRAPRWENKVAWSPAQMEGKSPVSPMVTRLSHWQSMWKRQVSLSIHQAESQNELGTMANGTWKHPQRQDTRKEGHPQAGGLRTAGGPQNRVNRMWTMQQDESYRWALTRDSAIYLLVDFTWKACPSECHCTSPSVQGCGIMFRLMVL